MITNLTQEHLAAIPAHVAKWVDLGLHPDQITKEAAQKIIDGVYKHVLKKPSVPVVLCPSPRYAWYAVCCYKSVMESVWESVVEAVRDSVGNSVRESVRVAVMESVWESVRVAVMEAVRDSVGESVMNSVWPWLDGHWMSYFFSYYDFFFDVIGVTNPVPEAYSALHETSKMDVIYPFDDVCIVSMNPTVHVNGDGRLHCENGPAIQYPQDGYYFLHGVRVSKELVETPAELLDPTMILTEANAEVRREIVRKIGIERVCQKLGAETIATGKDYIGNNCELIQLEVQGDIQRYIKLINPSVAGIYHIEGVPNECNTIEEALDSRKPKGLRSIPVDDITGADWFEQGDVCVWPKDAKTIKSKPTVLT